MKITFKSLESRIVIFHLIAIIFAAVTVPLANYLVINRSANQFEAQTLRAHATTIAQFLKQNAEGSWRLDLPDDLHALYAHGLDGLSYQVVNAEGRTLFASSPNSEAGAIPSGSGRLVNISRNNAVLYGTTLDHGSGAGALRIKVAQNVGHPDVIFDDIVADYLVRIGWLTVVILAILLSIDIFIIRKALVPLLHASRIASEIDPERTDLRLPVLGVPSELMPLITAMNEALGRLEREIKSQREFTADAAHELRTPLAVLRARVETFPDQDAMRSLKGDIEIMGAIINQLLEIAEMEGAALGANARCDLRAACADVVSMIADLAIAQGKDIALTGSEEPVWIRGNAAMVFRAVRNLVDNAVRHTQSGTTVEVDVASNGTITVKDRGPGVAELDRPFLFRRFWRARRNDGEGAGLGLAIVSRIAEMHDAMIDVSDHLSGGAQFSIHFRLRREN